jgi:hypothetical protein
VIAQLCSERSARSAAASWNFRSIAAAAVGVASSTAGAARQPLISAISRRLRST